MPADAPETPAERQADAGGKARLLTLADLDRRTKAAQVAFELRDRLVSERGGEERLSALTAVLIESVAVVSAMVRDAQVRWLKGEPVDTAALVALLNARRREAAMVGIDPAPADITPSLASYLAERATSSGEAA